MKNINKSYLLIQAILMIISTGVMIGLLLLFKQIGLMRGVDNSYIIFLAILANTVIWFNNLKVINIGFVVLTTGLIEMGIFKILHINLPPNTFLGIIMGSCLAFIIYSPLIKNWFKKLTHKQ